MVQSPPPPPPLPPVNSCDITASDSQDIEVLKSYKELYLDMPQIIGTEVRKKVYGDLKKKCYDF